MTYLLLHIGTRYTPAQAWQIIKRAKRFGHLREDRELDRWLSIVRKV